MMVVVRVYWSITPYHAQRVFFFLCRLMTLQRSGVSLEPGPSSLVLLPTNRKSTVGQYRGRGPRPERVRIMGHPMVERMLWERPKGAEKGK